MARKKKFIQPVYEDKTRPLLKNNHIKILYNGKQVYLSEFVDNKDFAKRLSYIESYAKDDKFEIDAYLDNSSYQGHLNMEFYNKLVSSF